MSRINFNSNHRISAGDVVRFYRAFTLIELLVVVALIVLLISMLLPALGQARQSAKEVGCKANLKAYGEGFVSYSTNNNRGVMKVVEEWGGRPYPNYIRRNSRAQTRFNGEWSIDLIKAYADGIDDDGVYGISICPSVDAALMQRFVQVRNIGSNHSFFEFQYTYWGGMQKLDVSDYSGPVQDDLTRRLLASDRIILTDIMYWDQSDRAWRYNHSPTGRAFNEYSWLPWNRSTPPPISGTNQAFGDGHVEWKGRAKFLNLDLMSEPAVYPDGKLGRRGSNGDTFYY